MWMNLLIFAVGMIAGFMAAAILLSGGRDEAEGYAPSDTDSVGLPQAAPWVAPAEQAYSTLRTCTLAPDDELRHVKRSGKGGAA